MVQHLVSDLGGVLVQLEWQERVSRLLNRAIAIEELHHLWVNAVSVSQFETGKISFEDFGRAFVEEFQLGLDPTLIQQEFLAIVREPMPGVNEVLQQLHHHFTLSLLSNTNPAHYERLVSQYDFFHYFDHRFLSYQIGLLKPQPAIFQYVINQLQADPQDILFFDDGARNVDQARRLGIKAFQVYSPQEIWAIAQPFLPQGVES